MRTPLLAHGLLAKIPVNEISPCTLSSSGAIQTSHPTITGRSHRQAISPVVATGEAIDRQALLQRCLNDAVFCGVILHKFANRCRDQASALERALSAENLVELAREAHTLQGVAANLSANRLRQLAYQLEQAAEAGDIPRCTDRLAQVQSELSDCAALVPELQYWLAEAAEQSRP